MKTKFTKGKWVKGYGDGLSGPTTPNYPNPTVDDERLFIPISKGMQTVCIVILPENNSVEEMEANAKLIAAAPKMIEALIKISKWLVDDTSLPTEETMTSVWNAIKKATK